ncbi:hypothetical protein Oweho_1128 [Owenweeksia hongkongensis DSM 17368]|uniref:Uncharacterized protein n=1 Tax=Owenweeksia hongkongensis (strain DSM 17368 / CIP 108786 / JCM 12287 / NRRL B-23963 / UST20020801) TaxID=926562 RepID=G8R589_OWEHD|nr:hypothetical protein [Owenweeksia hongkongensis]AEV32134.1 hypothetical protein Oweho_1128 [Owenweeksia hongkongensis DSM 17368]
MKLRTFILLLASLSFSVFSFGQRYKLSSEDEAQISRYILELNLELAADFDSSFIKINVDSLIAMGTADSLEKIAIDIAHPLSWFLGTVYYSPDTIFKVFSIVGNSGGSSKTMYYNFIHLNDSIILDMSWEYSVIDTILKISDSTYVIIDYSFPGYIMGSMTYNFRLLRFQADTLIPTPIDKNHYTFLDEDRSKYYNDYFSISSLHGLEDWTYMKYILQNNTIQFQYAIASFVVNVYDKIPESYLPLEENEALVVTGEIDLNQRHPRLQNQVLNTIKIDW